MVLYHSVLLVSVLRISFGQEMKKIVNIISNIHLFFKVGKENGETFKDCEIDHIRIDSNIYISQDE